MITAGARHVGGGDGSDVCLLTLAYLAARICKAEGSRIGIKRGFRGLGGSAPRRAGHSKPGRGSREVHANLWVCQELERPKGKLIRADFGFLCGVKGYELRTVLVKVLESNDVPGEARWRAGQRFLSK